MKIKIGTYKHLRTVTLGVVFINFLILVKSSLDTAKTREVKYVLE